MDVGARMSTTSDRAAKRTMPCKKQRPSDVVDSLSSPSNSSKSFTNYPYTSSNSLSSMSSNINSMSRESNPQPKEIKNPYKKASPSPTQINSALQELLDQDERVQYSLKSTESPFDSSTNSLSSAYSPSQSVTVSPKDHGTRITNLIPSQLLCSTTVRSTPIRYHTTKHRKVLLSTPSSFSSNIEDSHIKPPPSVGKLRSVRETSTSS